MSYRKRVAVTVAIDIGEFKIEELSKAVGLGITDTLGKLIDWLYYDRQASVRLVQGTEKAKTWSAWAATHGEAFCHLVRSIDMEVGDETILTVGSHPDYPYADGVFAARVVYEVTVH